MSLSQLVLSANMPSGPKDEGNYEESSSENSFNVPRIKSDLILTPKHQKNKKVKQAKSNEESK
jgi:hypothetical protein